MLVLLLQNMILKNEDVVICLVHDTDLPTEIEISLYMILELRDSGINHPSIGSSRSHLACLSAYYRR